jgi:hypothetical protein
MGLGLREEGRQAYEVTQQSWGMENQMEISQMLVREMDVHYC